jgi:acetyl esterase/lipase
VRRLLGVVALAGGCLISAGPAAAGPAFVPPDQSYLMPDSNAGLIFLPDQPYGTKVDRHHLFDAYLPLDVENVYPAVILIHGGGWNGGDKSSLSKEARYLARNGLAAFSVNYSPARESLYAPFEDVALAVAWIRAHADTYSIDPDRIGALGSSAGAHLASMLGVLTDGRPTQESGVRGVVAWSSPMDMLLWVEVLAWSTADLEAKLGCTSKADCEALLRELSPITYVSRNDPKLFFVHSRYEFLPVGMARRMDRRMDAAHARHTYIEMPGSEHARQYRDDEVPGRSVSVLRASLDFLLKTLSA